MFPPSRAQRATECIQIAPVAETVLVGGDRAGGRGPPAAAA